MSVRTVLSTIWDTRTALALIIFGSVIVVLSLRSFLAQERTKSRILRFGWQITAGLVVITLGVLKIYMRPVTVVDYSIIVPNNRFSDPVWNVWAEPYSEAPSFNPVKLQPNHEYSVFVDLSALRYVQSEKLEYVYSQTASSAFNRWLNESKDLEAPTVDILAVPDETFFAPLSREEQLKHLSINLKKMLQVQQSGFKVDKPPFQYLHSNEGMAPFRFGSSSFRVKTRDKVGFGALGLSIWADGKPVDELTFWACIVREANESCGRPPSTNDSLKGVDPTHQGIYPDAALHLVDLGPDVAVVFRCNRCGWTDDDYRTWHLGERLAWISDRLADILNMIGDVPVGAIQEVYMRTFQRAGNALQNTLFHCPQSEQALALNAWKEFLKEVVTARDKGRNLHRFFLDL